MFASLLTSISFTVMKCVKTIMKFVIMIYYRIHDDDILSYMKKILIRINLLKNVFKKYRFQENTNQDEYNEKHFNFFKWHALQHCINHIKKFDVKIRKIDEMCINLIVQIVNGECFFDSDSLVFREFFQKIAIQRV